MTEKQLIQDCQNGVKSSQYQLVKRYAGMLLSVARRYVSDEATAKDVLQEGLIKIFENIHKYKHTGSFEGWMRTITIRCALAHLRKSHRAHEFHIIDQVAPEAALPEIFSQLGMEDIIRLIQQLPNGFREVFNLNIIEGYSHREIGELLGISESTSRSQLTRARKLLQKLWLANEQPQNRQAR